jgi:hypothetical protein
MVSGSISPPYSGSFSPFPHGTCSLSVSQEYLALPDGAGRFRRDFSGPALLRIPASATNLPLRGSHPLRPAFPGGSVRSAHIAQVLQPPAGLDRRGLGPCPSLATTRAITIVFSSSGYLDVSVPRVRLRQLADPRPSAGGLPHSDTRGSIRTCRSPRLFAAYRVLLRL